MRIAVLVLIGSLTTGAAWAQTSNSTPPAAPPAGSGGGGNVGPSVSGPTQATGKTPPGTPTAATPTSRIARDTKGQQIIGHTATPATGVPGNTGGKETGAK